MRPYTIFWITWLALGLVVEFITIFNHRRGDTLSENVWQLMLTNKCFGWLVAAFLVWLLVHFLSFGKWA